MMMLSTACKVPCKASLDMTTVGQTRVHTVFVRYLWRENHHIYGHIRCVYTVLANPIHDRTPCPRHNETLRSHKLAGVGDGCACVEVQG
jgi:hypothetical protein